ncbi:MAG: hypothetical protein WC366_05040, partial [Bacilli bacterium]
GIAYTPSAQIVAEEEQRNKNAKLNKRMEALKKLEEERAKANPVAPVHIEEKAAEVSVPLAEPKVESAVEVKEEKKVVEPETKVVKTTTTLESLEKELESQKKRSSFEKDFKEYKDFKKNAKHPRKITDDEVKKDEKADENKDKNIVKMDIYTEEELREFAKDNPDAVDKSEENIDYEEFDKYYDDEDEKK